MRMKQPYELQAPKKAANLSVNSDLLAKARALDINLSATLERALAAEVQARQRAQWLAAHESAIASYNAGVEQDGSFSDGLRGF
jgi:antitoxin CcdA